MTLRRRPGMWAAVAALLAACSAGNQLQRSESGDAILAACERNAQGDAYNRINCLEEWLIDYGHVNSDGAHRTRYALANAWVEAGSPGRAREVLADLLQRDPGNTLAQVLYESLEEVESAPLAETASVDAAAPGTSVAELGQSDVLEAPAEPILLVRLSDAFAPRVHVREGVLRWREADELVTAPAGETAELQVARIQCVQCVWEFEGAQYSYDISYVAELKLWAIVLPIEQYLLGVVGHEMATGWPIEALRAQAVVSRTYAWSYFAGGMRHNDSGLPVVLERSTTHQVWRASTSVPADIREAVESTRGEVLLYDDHPIVAYFSADNGGLGELPVYVWGETFDYFKAVTDPYSDVVPRWEWSIEGQEFRRRISTSFLRPGMTLKRVRLLTHGQTRVHKVAIETNKGTVYVKGNDFRLKLGPTKLRSLWFTLEKRGSSYVFRGRGYGHGVGLSQWGARRRAQAGQDYRQILDAYYFGTEFRAAW